MEESSYTERALFHLSGKVAVVTGSASGIGAAVAERLASAGADVVCGWYAGDPHDVSDTVAAVERHGSKAVPVESDVGTPEGADRLIEHAQEELGGVDIVIANAAIARDVPTPELSDEDWHRVVNVDLTGVFRCFRAALPSMIDAGWGRLLATSSIAGTVSGWPQHVHYTASKAGVVGLVRGLAVEVAPHGITVNAIAPGVIDTPQSRDPVNSLGAEGLSAFAEKVPVGRNGRPEDIAAVFHFLASDEASYVTGQLLVVDGGATLPLA
jgi:3-oxoacyl-[acyl-carrier protein] reductase